MARATGIASQARGKIGNSVYYLGKTRAGRYEQLVKSYQPVVANPQSYAQALARVPVGPVQRICSALLTLIKRGFEGTAYGDPSKSEFLSYNLKYFRGPFLTKGSVIVPPGPMLIAKGSLSSIDVTEFVDDSVDPYVVFDLNYRLSTGILTKGRIATELLYRNPRLAYGEQLTFVVVTLNQGEYEYHYESLFLDPNDTDYPRGLLIGIAASGSECAIFIEDTPYTGAIVAAAVIRSQAYGESSFKRSTTFLTCNPSAELYNDEAAVRAAVASYRTGEDPEDWEDDPTPEYQKLAYVCMVQVTAEMVVNVQSVIVYTYKCLGYVTKGGEIGIFYKYSDNFGGYCLIDEKANVLTYTYNGQLYGVMYDESFEPARVYSSIYGTM